MAFKKLTIFVLLCAVGASATQLRGPRKGPSAAKTSNSGSLSSDMTLSSDKFKMPCGTFTCGENGDKQCPPCPEDDDDKFKTPCGTFTCGENGDKQCPPCPEEEEEDPCEDADESEKAACYTCEDADESEKDKCYEDFYAEDEPKDDKIGAECMTCFTNNWAKEAAQLASLEDQFQYAHTVEKCVKCHKAKTTEFECKKVCTECPCHDECEDEKKLTGGTDGEDNKDGDSGPGASGPGASGPGAKEDGGEAPTDTARREEEEDPCATKKESEKTACYEDYYAEDGKTQKQGI